MKQEKLFGNTIETLPTLVLHSPTEDNWQKMQSLLESRCNKEELLYYANAFQPWLGKYPRIMRSTDDGHTVEATECTLMLKSNSPKWEIAKGLALLLSDEQNLQAYLSVQSTELKTLWRMVLANVYVSMRVAKRIMNSSKDLYHEDRLPYYYYSDTIKWDRPEYQWFSAIANYSNKTDRWGTRMREKYITVSNFVRSLFFHHFFPEATDGDTSLAELPEGEWRILNLEINSMANFNLFCGLFQQDEFPLRKKGIGVNDIKRAQKKMTLTELFPDDDNEYRQNLRAQYYIQLLAINEHYKPVDKKKGKKAEVISYEDNLRNLISNFSRFNNYLLSMLFPHISGLRKHMTDYSRENKLIEMFFGWMREEPERWININDLLLKISAMECNSSTSRYCTLVFFPDDEQYNTILLNKYSNRVIIAEIYTQEFGYTALQALALMLCSLGIAEVAFNEGEHRNLSPFDAVDYIRLTPLGRYALGITDDYEAPEQEHVAYFELDADRLIIRSLVDPNPYAQLLLDTSEPISKGRFQTSALSFLANCRKREDVESKISIFRRFISNELPPLWEQFFQQLLQHCHPLKEDKTSYKRYTLSPDNRDLIQLITTDPELRQLVIRAEGYRIMVKTDDLKKFETQLKKHGYLL